MADSSDVAEARRALGRKLAAYRRAAGYNQSDFAPFTGYSRSTLANVETGRQAVARDFWQRCDTALVAAGALTAAAHALKRDIASERTARTAATRSAREARLERWREQTGSADLPLPAEDTAGVLTLAAGEGSSDSWASFAALLEGDAAVGSMPVTRLVHEWLVLDPPPLAELQAGRRIGEALVGVVERRVDQLRRADDFVGGGDLRHLVEQELRTTATLLREASCTEPLARRLFGAVGALCQLAGWVTADAGAYNQAARYFGLGIKAAHAAGDRPLAANFVSTLAYQLSNVGNRADGVLLAHTALTGAGPSTTPTARALFHERVAWAHARTGDRRQAGRALHAVEADFDRRRPDDDDPDWAYWLDEAEIAVMAARCHVELREPEPAIVILEGVLDRYDPRRVREVALYTSWLAEAHVQAGHLEEAARLASHTATLASGTNSARAGERVGTLQRQLAPHASFPAVRDFLQLTRGMDAT